MCANGHLPYLGALYHLPTSAYERVNLQQRKQLSTSVVPT